MYHSLGYYVFDEVFMPHLRTAAKNVDAKAPAEVWFTAQPMDIDELFIELDSFSIPSGATFQYRYVASGCYVCLYTFS